MRIGNNPHKDIKIQETDHLHQIIIPVYIPNDEGYFRDSFRVLQRTLESVMESTHAKTFITIVNNGSYDKVKSYLDDLFAEKKIHEVIHTENIGKMNAVIKGLSGNDIPLVTIADADVLFLPGWQEETLKIFNTIPKAGVVGLTPQIKTFNSNSGNVIFDLFFSSKLRFMAIKNPEAIKAFYTSIGWVDDYNRDFLKFALSVDFGSVKAIVGSGHFVSTFRRDIFDEMKTMLNYKLGGDTEVYFDRLPLQKDYWRLTTYDNYAYHMGNGYESWMSETESANLSAIEIKIHPQKRKKISPLMFFIKNTFLTKIIFSKAFYKAFCRWKGLPSEVARTYDQTKP